MAAGRILEPPSKLACARSLDPETAASTPGEELRVGGAKEGLLGAMGWAGKDRELAKRRPEEGSLIL